MPFPSISGEIPMSWHTMGTSALLPLLFLCAVTTARESRYAQTQSDSQYVHWIDLYDRDNDRIDVAAEDAAPYSPRNTCGRCHDYDAISHGYHFNAVDLEAHHGRPGEPWLWLDERTGTQLPLSYRHWPGTYAPGRLGISDWDFVLKFGRHMPGGGPGEPREAPDAAESAPGEPAGSESESEAATSKWHLAGQLNVDCLICHRNTPAYSPEVWWEQIGEENFSWAPTAALGLGQVDGSVSKLPNDFDPETAEEGSRYKLPQTMYTGARVNGDGQVFFDIIRKPHDNACYYCHSTQVVGQDVGAGWNHDRDVHLRAGMSCVDCHRNGIGHHIVRGFDGETHPTGESVTTLSCRGCHMGDSPGGRLGAPKPLHKGLPPLHLDRLACTTCHSGVGPSAKAFQEQTARAHGLGLPSHDYSAEMVPGIATSVLKADGEMLYPHRMVWPAFWGFIKDDQITPLNPEEVYDATRKTLRVRRGTPFAESMLDVKLSTEDKAGILGEDRAKVPEEEWSDEEKTKIAELERTKGMANYREKLSAALVDLKEMITEQGAEPVYVSGGKAYRIGEGSTAEAFDNDAAKPYAWKLGHNVRPARWSTGVGGCYECHSLDSPIFNGEVTAIGPAPDDAPTTRAMYELAGLNKTKLDAWSLSFVSRTAFKWFAFAAMGVVALVLFSHLFVAVGGMFGRRP
jgi:hypothetical protein